MFKFYFDGTEVQCPINWDDFEENIVRDDTIKGLLPRYDIKLQFIGNAYNYLYSLKQESGYCNLVDLRIDYKCGDNYETILNGYIFISDCKFNRNRCLVECPVTDDNFGARIYNNKNIKTELNTGKSKNGEDITVATEYEVEFFKPSDGTYYATKRKGVFVYDAFRYLIDFMTDGLVGFESDYLDYTQLPLGDVTARNIVVFLGEEIRVPSQDKTASISFNDLFKEVDKKYPIGFTVITGSDGRPTIKIENADYFYGIGNSITIQNIEDLNESFDNEILYSKVIFGGTTADYNATLHSFGQVQFLGFKEEEYHLTGECNIDKALDLKGEYIVDTNIIEEMVQTNTSSDTYDDDTFFVECRYYDATTVQAIAYEDLVTNSATPAYYNGMFANNKVAERYNLQGNIAQYLGANDVGFRASTTASQFVANHTNAGSSSPVAVQTTTVKAVFNNDSVLPNYDAAGNYSTVNYRYTSSQAGQYAFGTRIQIDAQTPTNIGLDYNRSWRLTVAFRRYNSSNTLLEDNLYYFPSQTGLYQNAGLGTFVNDPSHVMFLDSGDYAEIWLTLESQPTNYLLASNGIWYHAGGFFTDTTVTGGGIYEETEPKDYFVSKFEFEKPLSYEDYKAVKLDLSKSMVINHDGITNVTAWIRKVDRKLSTGETKFELISNLNNS